MKVWIAIAALLIGGEGGLAAARPAAPAPLACLENFEVEARRRPVGVETIHRTDSSVITIFLPLPATPAGWLEDLNALSYDAAYPERFSFSDGSLGTAFIEVDMRRSSRLRACVQELASHFRAGKKAGEDPHARLVHFLDKYLAPVPEEFRFPWEPARTPRLPPEFAEAADLPVGHFPLRSKLTQVEVPLEAFLKEKRGVCVQRVLLLSLLMKELGLRHRVRAGGIDGNGDGSDGGGGHLWIELPDRRHLDPTWHLLEKPTTEGALEGWFRMDRSYLFRNQVFPIAVDP